MSVQQSNSINNDLPKVIFGTSGLGNIFVALDDSIKHDIIAECVKHSAGKVVFDSAGKYGAGLALEVLGKHLRELNVDQSNVIISNKLGWYRTELKTPEPTFEPGVWVGLKHDAVQKISYQGMLDCFEQGNELLNGYIPQMVSVHDPDEYLAAADGPEDEAKRYQDILDAYRALADLKAAGKVESIGVGAKDWKSIYRIVQDVKLDWVMIANSLTIKTHSEDLLKFMAELEQQGVSIINSAVFHSGFLIGGDFYDYKLVDENLPGYKEHLKWRDEFNKICHKYDIKPAEACVAFALKAPGVKSIALSTTNPKRVENNIKMANTVIPPQFWVEMINKGLVKRSEYITLV
ncbi:aldo/keto reductase [Mucilaginibacter puniceus]